MDIIDIPRLVSMKRAYFMDIIDIWGLVSMKMAFFMDKSKKETSPKGCPSLRLLIKCSSNVNGASNA